MKAMVLDKIAPTDTDPLTLREVSDPQAGAGQIRLKVRCCGICRTDLHVIEGDLPARKLPLIPGHQIVGVVDQVGPGAGRFQEGDRVGVAWLRHTCGTCEYCASGRENLCGDPRFTGYHADGGYAELAAVDEDFAYKIPEGFDDLQAAPLLCAGIVGFRAYRRAEVPEGGSLAIYGFGSSAHVIAQIALARGQRLYVVTRGADHQRLACDMGALWAGDDARDMPADVDSAILFAPVGDLVPPALSRLRKGGTLSIAGIYLTDIPTLSYEKHLFQERQVRSVTANTREDGRDLLAEASMKKVAEMNPDAARRLGGGEPERPAEGGVKAVEEF